MFTEEIKKMNIADSPSPGSVTNDVAKMIAQKKYLEELKNIEKLIEKDSDDEDELSDDLDDTPSWMTLLELRIGIVYIA